MGITAQAHITSPFPLPNSVVSATKNEPRLYVSHDSALHYWRTNPPSYVLDGLRQNVRKLQGCPSNMEEARSITLSENDFGPPPFDVLTPPNASRIDAARLQHHIQSADLPPHALCPVYGGIHVVLPELCLVQTCTTHPLIEAFEIGMELCGTYALRPSALEDKADRNYSLVDAARFQRHVETWKKLRGLAAARDVANYLTNGSASPMETKLYLPTTVGIVGFSTFALLDTAQQASFETTALLNNDIVAMTGKRRSEV